MELIHKTGIDGDRRDYYKYPEAVPQHEPSEYIEQILFDRFRYHCGEGDMWPLTWAEDDRMYCGAGDNNGCSMNLWRINTFRFCPEKLTNTGDLLLSSRETSTIVCVTDIDSEPKVSYLLCDPSMWEGTAYEEYMFTKVGDFTAQAGQHTITVMHEESEALPEGQYYLYMFNNNFTYSGTRPQIKWDNYKGAGNYKAQADHSKYYRYLVDTKEKTFTLIKEFDVPYSPYVSSAENYGDNFVIASGSVSNYGEYDQEGTLIRHFEFNDEKYVYRVYKYEFENFYFGE